MIAPDISAGLTTLFQFYLFERPERGGFEAKSERLSLHVERPFILNLVYDDSKHQGWYLTVLFRTRAGHRVALGIVVYGWK